MDTPIHFTFFPAAGTIVTSPPPTLKESLKYDRCADQKYASRKKRKTSLVHGRKQNKKLVFNETVEVRPIPMRTEYSFGVRSRIWSNAVEIQQNAQRNSFEFATEGWDWRSVKEDHQMYRCMTTNELLHPCWVNGMTNTGGHVASNNGISFAESFTAL